VSWLCCQRGAKGEAGAVTNRDKLWSGVYLPSESLWNLLTLSDMQF